MVSPSDKCPGHTESKQASILRTFPILLYITTTNKKLYYKITISFKKTLKSYRRKIRYVRGEKFTQDRRCMYKRTIEVRSCNHRCRGKIISFTYYEFVLVALGNQHAMRMRNIVIGSVRLYKVFPHFLKNGTIFF
jgi:hypothetical protein